MPTSPNLLAIKAQGLIGKPVLDHKDTVYAYEFTLAGGLEARAHLFRRAETQRIYGAYYVRGKRTAARSTQRTFEELADATNGREELLRIGQWLCEALLDEHRTTENDRHQAGSSAQTAHSQGGLTLEKAFNLYRKHRMPSLEMHSRLNMDRAIRLALAIWGGKKLVVGLVQEDLDQFTRVLLAGGDRTDGGTVEPLLVTVPDRGSSYLEGAPATRHVRIRPASHFNVLNKYRRLMTIWRWLVRARHLPYSPFTGLEFGVEAEPSVQVTQSEERYQAMRTVAAAAATTTSNAFKHLHRYAAPGLGLTFLDMVRLTGRRSSQVRRLRREDIHLTPAAAAAAAGALHLFSGETEEIAKYWLYGAVTYPGWINKGKRGRRRPAIIPMTDALHTVLSAHLAAMPCKNPEAWLFPAPRATEAEARGVATGQKEREVGAAGKKYVKDLYHRIGKLLARQSDGTTPRHTRKDGWHAFRRLRAKEMADIPRNYLEAHLGWTDLLKKRKTADIYLGMDPHDFFQTAFARRSLAKGRLVGSVGGVPIDLPAHVVARLEAAA
jgi:hypothetical protein